MKYRRNSRAVRERDSQAKFEAEMLALLRTVRDTGTLGDFVPGLTGAAFFGDLVERIGLPSIHRASQFRLTAGGEARLAKAAAEGSTR